MEVAVQFDVPIEIEVKHGGLLFGDAGLFQNRTEHAGNDVFAAQSKGSSDFVWRAICDKFKRFGCELP